LGRFFCANIFDMESIISFADNPHAELAQKLAELYPAGAVGIIHDSERDCEELVKALGQHNNSARCYSVRDLTSSNIPSHIRAVIGAGSRRVAPLVGAQRAGIKCFLAHDYVIDYWDARPAFIVFDNNRIDKREALPMAAAYSNAAGILTGIIDYLAVARLKVGEPLSQLEELQKEFISLIIENKHRDDFTRALLYLLEKAWKVMNACNIYPNLVKDILRVCSRCAYPGLVFDGEEYCRQEFFISYLLLCVYSLFSRKKFNKPLLPKDINAILFLCGSLEIGYPPDLQNAVKADYTDKFFLLQEEESGLRQAVLSGAQIKRLSFNMRALMGKEFFKDLSYYDCLCYTLIANELRQKQGLINELAHSGFIDALMERAGAELSKYKTVSV
jgi:hypothetical protein